MTLTLDRPLSAIPLARLREIDAALGWVPEWHQMAPKGDWTYWLFVAGRGSGKTDAGAHFVDQHAMGPACLDGPVPHRIAIAAPTLGDARLTCVRGISGILSHNRDVRFTFTDGELFWPNGAQGRIFGAYTPEDIERWRGPGQCLVWGDELAAWRQLEECWRQIRIVLREGPRPRAVFTTTPKPRKLLKYLMGHPKSAVTTATTMQNPHLVQSVRDELYAMFEGTRIGRQELGGEVVEDVDGALWTSVQLDELRDDPPMAFVNRALVPAMRRIVVAVDPAASNNADSDETGIVVAGMGQDGNGWVLDDRSVRASPAGWASAAVAAYHSWNADRIVAEANNGGDMVEATIRAVDGSVPVKLVHASQGKRTRAEPVAARYEKRLVRHRREANLAELEAQMTSWDPSSNDSPDRMDAMVWALTELMLGKGWATVSGVGTGVA